MNVLINFSTLKCGGGQNVSMNFLYSFEKMELADINLLFFVAEGSEPHLYLEKIHYPNYFIVPRNPLTRILFEIFLSYKCLKECNIDIIYSYFGTGFFTKKIPQVSGSADSNLYFPEIDFWSDYKGIERLKKWIIDLYRIWGVKRSNAVVFENEALEARAKILFKLKNTTLIKPSINFEFEHKHFRLPSDIPEGVPKGLYLCGWHPNKNYIIIPELASELKQIGVPFHFIITAPPDNSLRHKQFVELISKFNVHEMVSIVGQVRKDQLQSLYEQIDYVFLLSKLESFSNNIIESWFFNKPLIVTDAAWSKSICGEAALYVNRDSIGDIVDKILLTKSDAELRQRIISNGSIKLKEYPTIEERINQELEFLRNVYKNT